MRPRFVRRQQAGVWRFLRALGGPAHAADDLAQDALLVALRRKVDSTHDAAGAAAFLRQTARHLWLRTRRDDQRRAAKLAEAAEALWRTDCGEDDASGLHLGLIDGINRRNVPHEPVYLDDTEVIAVRRSIPKGGQVFDNEALTGTAKAKHLRWLDLSGANVPGRRLAALAEVARLEVLNVSSIQLEDDFPADLPPGLRELHVCGDFCDAFCFGAQAPAHAAASRCRRPATRSRTSASPA